MNTIQDASVIAFRIERARRAPRNWTYWIAGFTAMNGLFLSMNHDFMVLAGLVLPFSIPGSVSHFMAAAILVAIAYASNRVPRIIWISISLYFIDTIFAGIIGIWSGLIMHLVVIALASLAILSGRYLARQQLAQSGGSTSSSDLRPRADTENS